jgi:hypothetical protein
MKMHVLKRAAGAATPTTGLGNIASLKIYFKNPLTGLGNIASLKIYSKNPLTGLGNIASLKIYFKNALTAKPSKRISVLPKTFDN